MKPIKVNDVDTAFGGNMNELLPPMAEIPEEFKRSNTKWNKVVNDWIFSGLYDCKWTPKEGINSSEALRHVQSILVSFDPKHEHKEAGCAYLLSCFFEEVEYKTT